MKITIGEDNKSQKAINGTKMKYTLSWEFKCVHLRELKKCMKI